MDSGTATQDAETTKFREVKWEPASLVFPVALSKTSISQLTASNTSSETTHVFKVKTTNPKRFFVKPNVGVVMPQQHTQVTVRPSAHTTS
jgi:hypothetical protein